jgi:putative endonuclease
MIAPPSCAAPIVSPLGIANVMIALVRAIHAAQIGPMREGWIYIVTNRPNGTLYVGVTSNLPRRIYEHRESLIDGFTARYGLKRLVYYERYDDIRQAIQREKNMKHWPRAWKVRLILDFNAEWRDLYGELA